METTFKTQDLELLKKAVNSASHIVIFPHTAPDGDALGSTLAWAKTLAQVKPEARITVISPDKVERYLEWLPYTDELCIYGEETEQALQLIAEADLIFHLDHNQISRLRYPDLVEAARQAEGYRIMIDHHLHPEEGFDVVFSFPPFSSTCELVSTLIEALGWSDLISPDIATLLASGIITDTGRFMYNCFRPEVFRQFTHLIAKGADYPYIIDQLSYHGTLEELKLRGYILHEKLEVYSELGAAIITLNQEEMQARGLSKGDTEGLVNLPLSVEGIDCVCFIREDKTQVKISLRSIGSFPVNILAQEGFGGGGHLNAAGGEWQGDIDGARQQFLAQLKQLRAKTIN